jgi:hypothetical protein
MKDIEYNQAKTSALLCCGRGRCPELSLTKEGLVKITDDLGGEIKIEKDQALLIQKAISQLSGE